MIKRTGSIIVGAVLLCTLVLCIPAVSAADSGQSWSDNPEHIAAEKAYVAYQAEHYRAQMNGAITYIGTISGSAGTGDLSGAEQQFSTTVASVQSMTTNSAIEGALGQMKSEIGTFRTDTVTDMKAFNGSASALHDAVNASVTADQATITGLENAWWAARETSRLDEFTRNDAIRNGALTNLSAKGIDVTKAQSIETQIDGLQASLKSALDAHDEKALASVNDQLGTLSTQFWSAISSASWQERETARLAEFDNRTAILQNELANLTARGTDGSSAQAILDQITAERTPLKAALDSHDQQALRTVDSQLATLYQQFRKTIQGYRQAAVETARTGAENSTRNLSFRQGTFRNSTRPAFLRGNTS